MEHPYRVAIREEGNVINCYIAPISSMIGARLIASIDLELVKADRELFEAWVSMMSTAAALEYKRATGREVKDIIVQPAPPYERMGKA